MKQTASPRKTAAITTYPKDRPADGVDFTQPESSRGNAILAGKIADLLFTGADEVCLIIREWGVWPSEESWPLFDRAMAGYEDPRKLWEAPGFLFGAGETADLSAIVRLALISGWSGCVVSAGAAAGFSLTDDDWLGMFAANREAVASWVAQEFLSNFHMKVLWEGRV